MGAVSSDTGPEAAETPKPGRPAWWVRLISHVPMVLLDRLADLLGWLAFRVFPYREHVVRENLTKAFPEVDEAGIRKIMRAYYNGFAQMLVELLKGATLSAAQITRRVQIHNLDKVQEYLAKGQSVLLVAAHQCNWEWMLLGLSTQLGIPVDAAYKPLVDNWAELEMRKLRSRFGARLIPAQELLGDIIKQRGVPRAIAMVADQEPVSSERKHWLRFLNRDTAFFLGAEEIARTTRYAAFFVRLERKRRGYYEVRFVKLAAAGEQLPAGEFTARYARLVEEQIRAAPADWPWSHKRWKLKKPLYGNT